jgi:hypothetical protein
MSKIQSDFPNHSDIEQEYNYFQGMATQSGQSSRVSEYYTLELKIVCSPGFGPGTIFAYLGPGVYSGQSVGFMTRID